MLHLLVMESFESVLKSVDTKDKPLGKKSVVSKVDSKEQRLVVQSDWPLVAKTEQC
jgi:hypothetical protein